MKRYRLKVNDSRHKHLLSRSVQDNIFNICMINVGKEINFKNNIIHFLSDNVILKYFYEKV